MDLVLTNEDLAPTWTLRRRRLPASEFEVSVGTFWRERSERQPVRGGRNNLEFFFWQTKPDVIWITYWRLFYYGRQVRSGRFPGDAMGCCRGDSIQLRFRLTIEPHE